MNDISEYGDCPHVLDADGRSYALKKALDVELADVPSTQHDEGVFLLNLAAAMESLNHIVYWSGECVAGRMSHNDFLVNVQCSASAARGMPERNCDTMDHFDMVAKRFKEEVCDNYDNDFEDPRTQCPHDCVRCVMKWMLSRKDKDFEGL